MMKAPRERLEALRFALNEAYALAVMAVIAAVLTAALVVQYGAGELPCPLCLLQRVAMLGVCFGPVALGSLHPGCGLEQIQVQHLDQIWDTDFPGWTQSLGLLYDGRD